MTFSASNSVSPLLAKLVTSELRCIRVGTTLAPLTFHLLQYATVCYFAMSNQVCETPRSACGQVSAEYGASESGNL